MLPPASYREASCLAASPLMRIDSFKSKSSRVRVKTFFANYVICFISIFISIFHFPFAILTKSYREQKEYIYTWWKRSQQHWKMSCGFLIDVWKVSVNSSVGLTWAWRAGPGSSPGGWGIAAGWSRWPRPFCPTTPASGSLQGARSQTAHLSSSTTSSVGM